MSTQTMAQFSAGSAFESALGPQKYLHDVTIVGAGPAGMMLAYCLTRLGIRPLIIDSGLPSEHEYGRGDGLLCRTLEVLQNLGLYDEISRNSVAAGSVAYWSITSNPSARDIRSLISPDIDIEERSSLLTRQGLVEQILNKAIEEHSPQTKVLRPWTFQDAHIVSNLDADDHVKVTLRSQYGETCHIRTRYLVGCDGGKSQVRRVLRNKYGVTFEGSLHDSVWAAIDILSPVTNFPDIYKLAILETRCGTMQIIPREPINGKECIRIYGPAPEMNNSDDESKIKDFINMIHTAFRPYTMTWDEVNWFTIYKVGQRIASKFDVDQRIFLAGDAAHIHSPKAGLGMNTSMMDAHNLATKLALVLKGIAKPETLLTYNLERKPVADHLLALDQELIELFAKHGEAMKNSANDEEAVERSTDQLQKFQRGQSTFQAGTSITYAENIMIKSLASDDVPSEAVQSIGGQGLVPGRRLLPAKVTRYLDGNLTGILDATSPFDGRFTVFLCLGDLLAAGKFDRVQQLKKYIMRSDGLWRRLLGRHSSVQNPRTTTNMLFPMSSVHPILRFAAVTTTEHTSIPLASRYEDLFRPRDSMELILFGPDMLFCDNVPTIFYGLDQSGSMEPLRPVILTNPIHQKWDIQEDVGTAIVLRPDGHVGAIVRNLLGGEQFSELAWNKVEDYFCRFLVLEDRISQ